MIGPLATGTRKFFEGAATLAATPRLWPYAAAPIAIAALAFGLGIFGGVELAGWAARRWLGGWTGVLAVFRYLALALGYLAAVAFSLVAAKTLILPVAASPFNAMISERTEALATGEKPRGKPPGAALRSALHAVATSLYGLAILVAFLPLLLLPGVGAALYFAPAAYVEALSALDATFARKGLTLGEKRAWLRAHFAEALGFGLSIVLVNLVPLAGLAAVPAAAAGGALLFLGKEPHAVAARQR
jgi:CysZ protein